MKKNTLLALLAAVALAAVVLWLYRGRGAGTIREELRDFAVDDTASITRLFIRSSDGKAVTLKRSSLGQWTVNDGFPARQDAIEIILATLKDMRAAWPVSKSAHDNVVRMMASSATKVEVYDGDDLVKTIYIGGETPDHLGTYMLLQSSSRPFVVQIPGFDGYLSTRFFTSEDLWRERTIFRYEPRSIRSISVEHPRVPEKSFTLSHDPGTGAFTVTSADGKETVNTDQTFVQQYFFNFSNVQYESLANSLDRAFIDSVTSSTPLNIVTVTGMDGSSATIKTFLKPSPTERLDAEGNAIPYDVDRLYGLIHNESDFVIIQYYVFDKILISVDDFERKGS